LANSIGPTIDGSSFSGLLTRVEIGHNCVGSAENGRIKSLGSMSAQPLVVQIGEGTLPEPPREFSDQACLFSAWVFVRERSPGNNKLLGSLDLPQSTAPQ
jgi:hypothetical protein